jgi:hypothetical protein
MIERMKNPDKVSWLIWDGLVAAWRKIASGFGAC